MAVPADTAKAFLSIATAAGRAINGWTLLMAAVTLVAIASWVLPGSQSRTGHSKVLRRVAVAIAVSLVVVVPLSYPWDPLLLLGLRPSVEEGSLSIEAAGLAAASGTIIAGYGTRVLWLVAVPLAGAAAQIYAGDHSLADVAQGWLFGTGIALLVDASTRPRRGAGERSAGPLKE